MNYAITAFIAKVLNIVLAVIVFFLGFRIIFQLFSANSNTPFVAWIYEVSSVIMAPFRGIFPPQAIGESFFDLPAIIALLIYAVVIQVIINLLDSLSTTHHVHTDREHVV